MHECLCPPMYCDCNSPICSFFACMLRMLMIFFLGSRSVVDG